MSDKLNDIILDERGKCTIINTKLKVHDSKYSYYQLKIAISAH